MTYLDMINSVLRRLRETEVSNVTDTSYSKLVGDFINDAKNLVEAAWDWTMLREQLPVTTVSGTSTYSLTSAGTRSKLLDAWNDTNNIRLIEISFQKLNSLSQTSGTTTGIPQKFAFRGVDGNGDRTVEVFPIPNGEQSLFFEVVVREPSLSDNADTTKLPTLPIVHLATALARRERGEAIGTSTAEYFAIADATLSDAIALDASSVPHETEWRAV